jgi:hypothetical protein
VHAEDFESSGFVLSSEQASGEINWTLSRPITVAEIQRAFSIADNAIPGAAPQMGINTKSDDDSSPTQLRIPPLKAVVWIGIILFSFWILKTGGLNDADDNDNGGFRSTGSVGGFGGK